MRFKVTMSREPKHTNSVIATGWVSSDEVLSVGDDQKLLKWNLISLEAHPFAQLSGKFYPTGMHCLSSNLQKQTASDLFVLTSTEGKFYMFNRNGRIDKVVVAHRGATISGRWSHDGSSFLTCGEDGSVKMWSKNGMLRSVLAQNNCPVYAIGWSADDASVIYCCDEYCSIKALKTQVATVKWKAHDGVVLCVDWNSSSNMIVTGGEDCKYKIWDEYGRLMFASSSHGYPIGSVAWNVDGDLLAVGSFNLLRLCDKAGWSYSLEKLSNGSIYHLSWSPDGTQIAGACADGSVLHAQVVQRRLEWRNIQAVQSKQKLINISDVLSDAAREKLETRDCITKMALGFEQLIVITTKQCYIFSTKNWNTPVIMDLKECNVSLIVQCEKYFLLIDGGSIDIFNYDGHHQCQLRLPHNAPGDSICGNTAAISNDTVAIRDRVDPRVIHLLETNTGKSAGDGQFTHSNDIIALSIDQCGSINERKVAFIDKSLDCLLLLVKTFGIRRRFAKLGGMISAIRFNDQTAMLAALQDNRLIVWTYPSVVFIDRDLLQRTVIEDNTSNDLGKSPSLLQFIGNRISFRRSDGATIPIAITPFPAALSAHLAASKWDQSIRLCRHINDDYLWAMLAAVATSAKNLYAAEIAYGALDEVEKVQFLSRLRAEQSKEIRTALMTAFVGDFPGAEAMLVQSGHIFRAIMLNISLFRWQRALELAVKHKMHLETVIGYRQQFLRATNREETDQNFLSHQSEVEIDWEHIQEMIAEDEAKELRI